MRRLVFGIAAFGLLFGLARVAGGQERITLSVAEAVTNTQYHVQHVDLDYDNGRISILLKGDQSGNAVSCAYTATTNPTGAFLITALNKANLASAFASNASTGSLMQRIYYRLTSAGLNESAQVCSQPLTGTITGSVP